MCNQASRSFPRKVLLAIALCSVALLEVAQAEYPLAFGRKAAENIATFSVCAYDPSTGEVGVAVQSKFFAVGSVVPFARAGVGAVASQAFGNPMYGAKGLSLMAEGVAPSSFLPELLMLDEYASQRQIGMVMVAQPPFAVKPLDPKAAPETATEENMSTEEVDSASGKQLSVVHSGLGEALTYTGRECMDWAGGRSGITPDGVIFCVQGNILTGADVVEAMAAAMQQADELTPAELDAYCALYSGAEAETLRKALGIPDLAGRLLRALIAGQSNGGDSRGMQSAALLVCQAGAGYGGYNDVKYDLRVDDAANPFVELGRILNLARPFALGNEAYNKLNSGEMDEAVALFEQITALDPQNAYAHYSLACGYSRTGRNAEALRELAAAIAFDAKLATSAMGDTDLIPLRESEEFKKLTAGADTSADVDAK